MAAALALERCCRAPAQHHARIDGAKRNWRPPHFQEAVPAAASTVEGVQHAQEEEELEVDFGYKLFYASEYQQLIDSGALVLTTDELEVFTPAVLRGLEKFDTDTHPTLQQLNAYYKELQVMATQFVTGRSPLHLHPEALSGRAGQPPCCDPPPGANTSDPAAASTPEAGAGHPAAVLGPADPVPPATAGDDDGACDGGGSSSSLNSDEDDDVDEENPFNFPLPPESLQNMGLSDETEWLGRARAKALIRLLRYRGSPEKQREAKKASGQLTTAVLTQALFHMMLPNASTCPPDYVALTKAAYPFGRKWCNRNIFSLRDNHTQGNGGGAKGCVTHRHVDAVAKSERARVALRQYLGQPLPPGPPDMTTDEWGEVFLASQWRQWNVPERLMATATGLLGAAAAVLCLRSTPMAAAAADTLRLAPYVGG